MQQKKSGMIFCQNFQSQLIILRYIQIFLILFLKYRLSIKIRGSLSTFKTISQAKRFPVQINELKLAKYCKLNWQLKIEISGGYFNDHATNFWVVNQFK